jgi:hypothetical protein
MPRGRLILDLTRDVEDVLYTMQLTSSVLFVLTAGNWGIWPEIARSLKHLLLL